MIRLLFYTILFLVLTGTNVFGITVALDLLSKVIPWYWIMGSIAMIIGSVLMQALFSATYVTTLIEHFENKKINKK